MYNFKNIVFRVLRLLNLLRRALLLEGPFQRRNDLLLPGEDLLLVDGVVGDLAAECLLESRGCPACLRRAVACFLHDICEHQHYHVQLLGVLHIVHLCKDSCPLGIQVLEVHDLYLAYASLGA